MIVNSFYHFPTQAAVDSFNPWLAKSAALWHKIRIAMPELEPPDEISLEDLRANRADAWASASRDLHRVISRAIRSVVPYATSSEQNDLAADIVNSAVVQIIDPSGTLFVRAETWKAILNITAAFARKRAIDFVRKRVVRQREDSDEKIKATHIEPPQPADEAIDRERKRKVNAAIAALDPEIQRLLTDFYFEGKGTREIAAEYGSTNGKICYRLVEARKRLEEELRKQGLDEGELES